MGSRISYDGCLCCGSKAVSTVMVCKDYTVSQEVFEIWQCSICTFRFTQNVPDKNDVAPYYQSAEYVSHTDIKKGLINQLYHQVRKKTLRSKSTLVKRLSGLETGHLLDVGAGTGAFANTMKASGWQVTGLEPDDIARANAQKNHGLELLEIGTLETLPADSFDVITLWHVLEHVHDLHHYLERFAQLLKANGRLIVAVPNYTSYDAQVYKGWWAAYDVPRHLYHWSPKSMQVLVERKGFVVDTLLPMWYDSFYVSMLSEKYKNGGNLFAAFYNGLRSNISAYCNVSRCSSVIYVLRKP